MKKKGCRSSYKTQRDKELYNAFKREIIKSDYILLDDVWHALTKVPCSRFWISEERAAVVVSRMLRGDTLKDVRPLRKMMLEEIFRQYKILHKKYPYETVTRICIRVVNSPAPSFYMTPLSIRQTIYKIRQRSKW